MKTRSFCVAAAGMLLAVQAPAQSPAPPQTYAFTATSNMFGAMTVTVNRNGSKELIEMVGASGGLHLRVLYDFQAHRIYTVNLDGGPCTTQEYSSPYAPAPHDPIGGGEEMARQAAALPVVGRETVNGIATRLVEAPLEGAQGKYRIWLEEKFGFAVKQAAVMGSEPEKLMFEMRQLSYAPSPATLFTAPANCSVVGGVVNATGGHAETNVDVSAQAEARLKGGPPAKKAFKTGPDPLAGKWKFLGKDGSGASWDGTLAIDKPGADSYDDGTYTNICDLNMSSANSGKGMSGPCLYDAKAKTLTFAGGGDSSKFSFTAVLSPDGKSLTQGRWVEAKGNGAWSAKR